MAKYRILSLDGGGIRGIITAIILERLNGDQAMAGWLDQVNLIAGTSTGGLLTLGLAHGLGPEAIRALYKDRGAEIFADTWLDDLVDLGKLRGADYNLDNLERELRGILGETKLKDLQRRVLITAFDLDNEGAKNQPRRWKPKLFHNFPGPDSDGEQAAYKVGLYTAAAPTYFPSADGFVDGGVFATNPSMCALAQTQDDRTEEARPALTDIVLLSIGTGTSLIYIEGKANDWGYLQWAQPLVSLMLEGVAGIATYQCNQILGARHHRVDPTFPPDVRVDLDDVSKIPYMIEFANGLNIDETTQWLKDHWLG